MDQAEDDIAAGGEVPERRLRVGATQLRQIRPDDEQRTVPREEHAAAPSASRPEIPSPFWGNSRASGPASGGCRRTHLAGHGRCRGPADSDPRPGDRLHEQGGLERDARVGADHRLHARRSPPPGAARAP